MWRACILPLRGADKPFGILYLANERSSGKVRQLDEVVNADGSCISCWECLEPEHNALLRPQHFNKGTSGQFDDLKVWNCEIQTGVGVGQSA